MEDTREYLEFRIFVIGKSRPIIEQRIINSRLTLESRLNEIKNGGVFEKLGKLEEYDAVWYPPHQIEAVEYRHVNGP